MIKESDFQFLQSILTFWDDLDDADKNLIIKKTVNVKYTQGENIHSADNDCMGVLIVKTGELRTYILSESGKEVTLYRSNSGDVCIPSASCLINRITSNIHIDAEADSEVFLIHSYIFSKLQIKYIYVENFALKITVDKFSDVMWAMEQMLFMKLDRRLAIFLYNESMKTDSNDIKLTHEQIAKYIGSAREVVSRMMKFFESKEIVKLYRGNVKIINKSKLKELI